MFFVSVNYYLQCLNHRRTLMPTIIRSGRESKIRRSIKKINPGASGDTQCHPQAERNHLVWSRSCWCCCLRFVSIRHQEEGWTANPPSTHLIYYKRLSSIHSDTSELPLASESSTSSLRKLAPFRQELRLIRLNRTVILVLINLTV